MQCNNSAGCKEHVDIGVYGANLVEIWRRFSTIGKTLIWTTTTPVPNVTTSLGRTYAAAEHYNAQALKSLSAANPGGLLVNDLWGDMIAACGAGYTSCALQLPKNVHLTPAGINVTALSVFKSIMAALAG